MDIANTNPAEEVRDFVSTRKTKPRTKRSSNHFRRLAIGISLGRRNAARQRMHQVQSLGIGMERTAEAIIGGPGTKRSQSQFGGHAHGEINGGNDQRGKGQIAVGQLPGDTQRADKIKAQHGHAAGGKRAGRSTRLCLSRPKQRKRTSKRESFRGDVICVHLYP